MAWINELFGTELSDGLALALLFVGLIIVLLLVFWLFRKVFGGPGARHSRSRQPRLSVTDVAAVDDKRRLILVRRDHVEHLVMIGGPSDIVVEQNIVRLAPVPAPMAVPAPATEPASAPAPSQSVAAANHASPATQPPVSQTTTQPVRTEPGNSSLFSAKPDQTPVQAAEKPAASPSLEGAALAGAGALAVSAKEFVASAADTAKQTASETSDTISTTSQTALKSLSDNLDISPASPATRPIQRQETDNADASLTDDLEAALAMDEPATASPAPEVTGDQKPKDESNKTEDEMQRLLKELAAGN